MQSVVFAVTEPASKVIAIALAEVAISRSLIKWAYFFPDGVRKPESQHIPGFLVVDWKPESFPSLSHQTGCHQRLVATAPSQNFCGSEVSLQYRTFLVM